MNFHFSYLSSDGPLLKKEEYAPVGAHSFYFRADLFLKLSREANRKLQCMSPVEKMAENMVVFPYTLRVHHNQQWVGYVEKCRL